MTPSEKIAELLNTEPPREVPLDGAIHRWGHNNKFWARANQWIYKGNIYWRVVCGDWSSGQVLHGYSYDPNKESDGLLKKSMAACREVNAQVSVDKMEMHKKCAEKWQKLFKPVNTPHPYLEKKKIQNHNTGNIDGTLIVPVYNIDKELVGVQKISSDGKKMFSKGISLDGTFHPFGEIEEARLIYLTEGFATGATVYEATGKPTVSCFSAFSISKTMKAIRMVNKSATIVICADNDKMLPEKGYRTGEKYAEAAKAQDLNCSIAYPSEDQSEICDFNDIGKEKTAEILSKINPEDALKSSGFTEYDDKNKIIRRYDLLWDYYNKKTNYIYCADAKLLYVYNKTHYVMGYDAFVENFAQEHFVPYPKSTEIREFCKKVTSKNVHTIDFFDDKLKDSINFKNGVYNYVTKKFIPNSPSHKFTHVIPHDYDPDAKCPTWDLLISNLLKGRKGLITQLEQFMGYALSGMPYTKHQSFMIFFGGGANGKTTILNAISEVLGNKNVSAVSMATASSDNSRFDLPQLEHSLLNIGEEEPVRAFSKTGTIKKITGNSKMTMEHKGKPTYPFTATSKILVTYNEMPQFGETSQGMMRRGLVIPFDVDVNKNRELRVDLAQLEKESSGIINRFIQGLDLLNESGFIKTPESEAILNQIEKDSDPFIEWMSECVEMSENHDDTVPCYKFLESFRNFGVPATSYSDRCFYRKLATHLGRPAKKYRIGGIDVKCHKGLKILF